MPHSILMPADFTALSRFDAEMAQIFERSWVHVADTTELPEPGSYVPGSVGRTPVLVVRGHDGAVRAFLNACPHRGATLAESPGRCEKNLRCPYHGWSFATDGALQGVPFREEFDCDLSGRNLVPLRTSVLGPLVFACLDASAPPFETWAGELSAAFARFGVERWHSAFAFDYDVRTNWKTYVENGLGGYHIPFVHDFLASAIDAGTGANFFEAHGSYSTVEASAELTPPGMERGQFRFGMVFPNLIPVFSPIDFTYLRIDPIDAEHIRLRGRAFDGGGGGEVVPRELRAAAFDATNKQDIAVVERVQRGLRARGLPAAVHSDLRESRITHFEKLVAAALG